MIIDNRKIHDYIVEKDRLVGEGRKNEDEIQTLEKKIKVYEDKEKAITGKIKPDEQLKKEGDGLVLQLEKIMKRLEELGKMIEDKKLEAIPKQMKEEHQALMKEREEKERKRNKIALKVQKIKDMVVPLIQKHVKPLLKEYDDIETAKTKDGKVVIDTFNHLEDFKRAFKGKQS